MVQNVLSMVQLDNRNQNERDTDFMSSDHYSQFTNANALRVISVNDLIRRPSPIWNSLSDHFYFNWLMHVLQFRNRGPNKQFPTVKADLVV